MDTEHIVIYEAAYKYSAKNVKLKIKYHWQNVNNNPKYSNHQQIIKKRDQDLKTVNWPTFPYWATPTVVLWHTFEHGCGI